MYANNSFYTCHIININFIPIIHSRPDCKSGPQCRQHQLFVHELAKASIHEFVRVFRGAYLRFVQSLLCQICMYSSSIAHTPKRLSKTLGPHGVTPSFCEWKTTIPTKI
jgi:hypothetical protein